MSFLMRALGFGGTSAVVPPPQPVAAGFTPEETEFDMEQYKARILEANEDLDRQLRHHALTDEEYLPLRTIGSGSGSGRGRGRRKRTRDSDDDDDDDDEDDEESEEEEFEEDRERDDADEEVEQRQLYLSAAKQNANEKKRAAALNKAAKEMMQEKKKAVLGKNKTAAPSTSPVLSDFFDGRVHFVPFSIGSKPGKWTLHKSMTSDIGLNLDVPDDPVDLKSKSIEVAASVVILALLKELSANSLYILKGSTTLVIESLQAKAGGDKTNIAFMNTGGGFWDKNMRIIGVDDVLTFDISSKGGKNSKTYEPPTISIYVPAANNHRIKRLNLRCMIEMHKLVNDEVDEEAEDDEGKDEESKDKNQEKRPSKEEIDRRLEELQDTAAASLRLQVAGRTSDLGSRDLCYSQFELDVITALDKDRLTYVKAADCVSITKASGAKTQATSADTGDNALMAGFGGPSSSSSGGPSKANQAKANINVAAASSTTKHNAFVAAVQKMVASKYATDKQLFDALFPPGISKEGYDHIKKHDDLCRVIANAYSSKFADFKSIEIASGGSVLELPESFPFSMMNGSVQFKAGRGIDDYEVLVAMHNNGSHTFKTALSTKPVNETSAGAHLAHALVPPMLAKPLVLAAGSVLTALQQTAMNEGKAKSCPLCGKVSGTKALTCRDCSYEF